MSFAPGQEVQSVSVAAPSTSVSGFQLYLLKSQLSGQNMARPGRHPSSNLFLLGQAAVWNILSAREQMARCHICKICLNRISVNLWLSPLIMAFPASSSALLPGIKPVYSFSTSSCCCRTSRRRSFSSSIMSSHAVFPLSHIAPIPSRPYLADMTEWCCPLAILQTNVSKS